MNIDSKILLHLSTQGFLVFLSLFYNFNAIYELNKDYFIIAKGKKTPPVIIIKHKALSICCCVFNIIH